MAAQPPVASLGHSHHGPTFNEALLEQLKRTPWFMISVLIHLVVIVLGHIFATPGANRGDLAQQVNTQMIEKEIEEPEEIKPEIKEEEIKEEEVENPELLEESDVVTEDTESEVEADDADADEPFTGKSGNEIIGLGGGAGGAFGGRRGGKRKQAGGRRADLAVEFGLQWLANHQSEDGSWDCDDFMVNCKTNQCTGKGHPLYDPGVSGLSLLAFLGAGYTHDFGKFKETVKKGLRYIKNIQDSEGCFGGRSNENFTYGHAICALAMAEAYGLTGSPLFKSPAQKGIDFIHEAKNPYKAWRYGVRPGENDSSVTGWMVMALKSAKLAGLTIHPDDLKDSRNFFDEITDEYGKVGYTQRGNGPVRTEGKQEEFPSDHSEALTAVGVLCRVLMGEDPATSDKIKKGAGLMAKKLPVWDKPKLDFYYWYYGTLAMYQVGGSEWNEWNKAMQTAIIDRQRKDGDEKGSWDPEDAWGEEGGRVYSTALLTLCLEVYYRYDKVFGTTADRKAPSAPSDAEKK